MPHIVVEYSNNLENKINVSEVLTKMHDALVEKGVDKTRIKTRGISLAHSVVGDASVNDGAMVHITLLLLAGRDDETKISYSKPIHDVAVNAVQQEFPNCAVTLEVRDMDTETYIL